jgi:segregation and condensation protein B
MLTVDEDGELVEIEYLDGDIEELDLDTWHELDLERIAQPEGWVAPEAAAAEGDDEEEEEEDEDLDDDDDDWDEDDDDDDDWEDDEDDSDRY